MFKPEFFLFMRKSLLLVLLLSCQHVFGQSWELGAGIGISTNTQPTGNMEYVGDQGLLNYSTTLKLAYTTKSNWQFVADGHLLELSSKSSKKYGYYWNDGLYIASVGGDDKKLVYSKYTMSLCLDVNKKFAFANNTGAFYVGPSFGYGFARNNSKRFNSNESYKGPDGGLGFVYGLQLGLTKDFSDKIAFNFEAAMRAYNFHFTAEAPQRFPAEKLHYGIIAFPITIGLRYYIFRVESSSYGTYNTRRNRYF